MATNRADTLDPALLRPGRFDRHIQVDRPSKKGRVGILKVHCRKVPLADDVDLQEIAGRTIGFSGAELRNLVNEAALKDEDLEKDRKDDPRFTLTAAEVKAKGIEDFQLNYALETLRRTSPNAVARR